LHRQKIAERSDARAKQSARRWFLVTVVIAARAGSLAIYVRRGLAKRLHRP